MALLWRAGVRGTALTIVSAWKDVLLVVALALVSAERPPAAVRRARRLARARLRRARRPLRRCCRSRGSAAARRTRACSTPRATTCCRSAAYFLGRGLDLSERERSALCHTVLATAAFVAAFGLIDVYAVPLSFWRHASGWFCDQLGLTTPASPACRRTSSTTRGTASSSAGSPRRSSRRSRRRTCSSWRCSSFRSAVAGGRRSRCSLFAALLWTHTRSALLALVFVLARARAACAARCGRSSSRPSSLRSGSHS